MMLQDLLWIPCCSKRPWIRGHGALYVQKHVDLAKLSRGIEQCWRKGFYTLVVDPLGALPLQVPLIFHLNDPGDLVLILDHLNGAEVPGIDVLMVVQFRSFLSLYRGYNWKIFYRKSLELLSKGIFFCGVN